MTLLEEFVAEINGSIYYREFSFSRNDFTPTPGEDKEFADHVIWIDDLLMVFQIKERSQPDDNEAAAARWFQKKVIDLGSRQIRDTLGFLQEYESISIENQRGHRFDVADATVNHCVNVIVYYGGTCLPGECAATRHHQSRTAGFIHVISSSDYFLVSRTLLTPAEIVEYLEFREELVSRCAGSTSLPSEEALLGQYLCEALDAEPHEDLAEYLGKLKVDPSSFDLSGFLGSLGDKLIEGDNYSPGHTTYYPILAEFAKLTRLDLVALKERFLLAGQAADADRTTLPYRIVAPRSGCGFLIAPITSSLFADRLDWLKTLTRASKYECRFPKQIGVAVSRQGGDQLVEWCYLQGGWQHDDKIEELLRYAYPFRPLKLGGRFRYEFQPD